MPLTWSLASEGSIPHVAGAWEALAQRGPCDRFALLEGEGLAIHRATMRGVRVLRAAPPHLPARLAAVRAGLPGTLPASAERLIGGGDIFLPHVHHAEERALDRLGFTTAGRLGDVRSLLRLWGAPEEPELASIAKGLEAVAALCARYGTILLISR
ncbi:MAG: hypothetical protein JWP97_4638 [Labilithrix sp.]|nr:hypothetical protein [Labilithrix sp.]